MLCIRADLIHSFYAIRRATYEAAPSDYRCKLDQHPDQKAHGARVFYTPEVSIDHHSREYRADSTDPLEGGDRLLNEGKSLGEVLQVLAEAELDKAG